VSQSKKGSFIEAWANVLIGFGISMVANIIILGAYGYHLGVGQQFKLTLWFTAISIARSYLLRRLFNRFKKI
jgi:hypothetical protein